MEQEQSQSNYNNIINDPLYKDIKLNEKLTEELKLSETLCNQVKNSLERYYQDLQNNFNNINSILGKKQELKENIGDLDDHNSRLIKLLVGNLEERNDAVQSKDKEIQEKDSVIQYKDKEIQEKDNVIQYKDKEIHEKNKIIQRKDDLLQGKNNLIQQKDNHIKSNDNLIQEQKKEIQVMREEIEKLNKEIQKIQEKDYIIQELVKKVQEKDETIQEKNKNIQSIVEKYNIILEDKDKKIQNNDNKIQEKDKKIQDLEQDNHKLKKKASEYQSSANFRFSDDKYNLINLNDEITNLQRTLENYITRCKGNVEINISGVQNLLKKYGSNTIITIDHKSLIKAVLQRHVIEQIFKYGEEYFDCNKFNHEEYGIRTETNLYNQTYELVQLAEVLASERDGVDQTTETLPIKLRQEVFAALRNRAFSNIVNTERTIPHEFISKNKFNLNKEINKYRKLKDPEQNQEIEDMAGDIIRKTIALFWFRIEIQEPVAEYRWFNYNDKIKPSYMEGTWEDDEINHIGVDICYFPIIECKDGSKRQVYTPAKVHHKWKF